MRRVSTRARAKVVDDDEAPTPVKRATRRGRRKKTETSSEQDSESEEEVMPTPKTRRAIAPPAEERPVPSTPGGSRTRRSSRRLEPAAEEPKPAEPIVDLEADNNVDRDSNGSNENEADSSTVWKVQNSNGSGTGIAKLKLCRSGPVDQPEVVSPRRRRGARDPDMHTVVEVDESVPQHVKDTAQPSPTPEPDSSGLTGKVRAVRRLEEISKESSTSSSSSSSSTSSSSSSEKSRSSTPDKAESEPVEEDEDDEDDEDKDDTKDVEDKEEEDEDDEIQAIKEDSTGASEPSEEATSVEVPSETADDAGPISVPSKSSEDVEEDSSSREAEEKSDVEIIEAPAHSIEISEDTTSQVVAKSEAPSHEPEVVEQAAAGATPSDTVKENIEVKTIEKSYKVHEAKVTELENAKHQANKIKDGIEEVTSSKPQAEVTEQENTDNKGKPTKSEQVTEKSLEKTVVDKTVVDKTVVGKKSVQEAPAAEEVKVAEAVKLQEKKGKTIELQEKKDEPNELQGKKDEPIELQEKKDMPVKLQEKKDEPFKLQAKKVEPGEVQKKKDEPVEIQKKKVEPGEVQKKKDEPGEVQKKKDVPVELQEKKDKPVELQEKKDKPVQLQEKKDKPVEPQERKDEPVELQKKKDEPVELQKSKDEPIEHEEKKDKPVEKESSRTFTVTNVDKAVKDSEVKRESGTEKPQTSSSAPTQPAEEDEQSDDEPVMDLAPGSPVEPDPEMAEAEAIEAQVEEKTRGRRRHHHSASSSSSGQTSSSESDSESCIKRKKKRSSIKDSDKSSSKKLIHSKRGPKISKKEEGKVVKEPLQIEPVHDQPPAPPTRLRRNPPIAWDQSEKVPLRRTISGQGKNDQGEVEEATVQNHSSSGEATENKENSTSAVVTEDETKPSEQPVTRKRRWGSCKSIKKPVLCISSDPLKNLIPDAKPVAESEVHLNLEEEGEDLEDDERSSSLDRGREREVVDRPLPPPSVSLPETTRIVVNTSVEAYDKKAERKISVTNESSRATNTKLPSLPKQRISTVLYITNLVRPFTIGQLRELLSRTGKFAEGGFWINDIKSRCYVEYENEDQAVETRHALHGVHWPISNRKALHVEFAKKEDLVAAQAEIEGEPLIVRKPHQLSDSHHRELKDPDEKLLKVVQPVREWDLGKVQEISMSESREGAVEERKKRDEERRVRREKRSLTPSHEGPARKAKRNEEAAPAKLLDDLFRKTKTTPCIYWLPLTPEQIAEKEEMRRKHMAEHERLRAEMRRAHERNMQRGPGNGREQDRGRDRDREREKTRDRDRERERERERERDRKDKRRGSKDK